MTEMLADPKLLWYVSRSTGAMCLLLLTASMALGLAAGQRVGSARWPRFLTQGLHRNVALLAVLLLAGHVAAVVLDDFVDISLVDAVLPFVGSYRPLWLGFGAIATDLMLLVVVTSLVRTRLSNRLWKIVHATTHLCWPVALLHGLGTGSDPRRAWFALLAVACAAGVAAVVLWRLRAATGRPAVLRLAAGVLTLGALAGIAGWTAQGPMQPGWAARSGTPAVQNGAG